MHDLQHSEFDPFSHATLCGVGIRLWPERAVSGRVHAGNEHAAHHCDQVCAATLALHLRCRGGCVQVGFLKAFNRWQHDDACSRNTSSAEPCLPTLQQLLMQMIRGAGGNRPFSPTYLSWCAPTMAQPQRHAVQGALLCAWPPEELFATCLSVC